MKRKRMVVMGVLGTTVGGVVLLQAGSDSNGDGFIEFADGDVITAEEFNTNFDRTSAHILSYENAMTITEDGKVGIGGSPIDDESLFIFQDEAGTGDHLNLRLHKLEGGEMIQLGDSINYDFNVGIDATDDYTYFGDTSTPNIFTLRSGNVGIGTSTPQRRLVVQSNTSTSTANTVLYNSDGTNNNSIVLSFRIDTSGSGASVFSEQAAIAATTTQHNHTTRNTNLEFYTGDSTGLTSRMTILGNGNVGIGSSSPGSKLEVNGGIRATEICDEVGSNCKDISTGWTSSSQWTTNGSAIYYSGGYVGLGISSPSAPLHINSSDYGAIYLGNNDAGGFHITKESTDDSFNIWSGMFGSGNNRFKINSSGNVSITGSLGVGTSSPATKLHVTNTTAGRQNVIAIEHGTAIGDGADITWQTSTALASIGSVTDTSSQDSLRFSTRDTTLGERMRITGSGNVGIGTTSPQSKLDVSGIIRATDLCDETGSNCKDISAGWTSSSQWTTTGSDIYYSSGKVGIGTSSPTYSLTVSGSTDPLMFLNKTTSGNTALWFGNSGTINGHIYVDASKNMYLSTVTTNPAVFIAAAGNVGVSTSSPTARLHVKNATSGGQNMLALEHGTAIGDGAEITWQTSVALASISSYTDTSSTDSIRFSTRNTTIGEKMRITGAGSVGIGTTAPAYKLEVAGSMGATSYTTVSDVRLKKEIEPLENALENVQCLNGVTYFWRNASESPDRQIGLIAQDVEKCFPEAVTEGTDGYKGVLYSQLISPLIEAVKELASMLDDQQEIIASQDQRLAAQETRTVNQQRAFEVQQRYIDELTIQNRQQQKRIDVLETQSRSYEARFATIEGRFGGGR